MRLLVIILAIATLAPAVGAQNMDPDLGAFAASQATIDLIADAGNELVLSIMATDPDQGDRVVAVEFVLRSGTHVQVVNPVPSPSVAGRWEAKIKVNDVPSDPSRPMLLVGTWDVIVKAWDRFGGFSSRAEADAYTVTAADAGAHPLQFDVFDAVKQGATYERMDLGPSDAIRFHVAIPGAQHLVRSVTYQLTQTSPSIALAAPYVVPPELIGEGTRTIVAHLEDRAGRTASISLPLYVDLTAPEVSAAVPDITYQGVPFDVAVAVNDASAWTAFVTVESEQQTHDGEGDEALTTTFSRDVLGNGSVLIIVVDALGNTKDLLVNITTVEAITDTTGSLAIAPKFPLPGQPINFTMELKQKTGVTELPVTGRLLVAGRGVVAMPSANLTVGATSTQFFQASFLPGAYEANFTVFAGELVNETDARDQTALASFEVFLGKVVVEATGADYYIRVDGFGLPAAAVSTGGASYPLTLDQSTGKDLYVFTVGDETYAWNANERITIIGADSDPGEDTPHPGAALVMLALLAVALARRRK